ncbi:hypothetical protein JCM10450v2_004983 [Rhodotorula kratochvilovae]
MDPSPTSSAPAPPRASFASLPLELVKQIVAEVNEQDKAYLGVKRARHGEPSAYGPRRCAVDKEDEHPEPIDAGVDVVWSYWYGRGISALSFVNKQLRAVALPSLVETVTMTQLTKPVAAYLLAPSHFGPLVRHVDLRQSASSSAFFAAIPILHSVSNLETLSIARRTIDRLLYDNNDDGRLQLEVGVFAAIAHRVQSLTLQDVMNAHNALVIPLVCRRETLRHLVINAYFLPFAEPDSELRDELSRLKLEKLDIADHGFSNDPDDPPDEVDPAWFAAFSIPTLTTFRLAVSCALPANLLEFLASAFPNLEHLKLTFSNDGELCVDGRVPPAAFPHLRSVTLHNRDPDPQARALSTYIRALAASPSLERNTVATRAVDPVAQLDNALRPLPSFAPALRAFVLDFTVRAVPPSADERLEAEDVAQRIGLPVVVVDRAVRVPELLLEFEDKLEHRPGGDVVFPAQAEIDETLAWASQRAGALARARDGAALRELAEAVKPLAQRRFLEER